MASPSRAALHPDASMPESRQPRAPMSGQPVGSGGVVDRRTGIDRRAIEQRRAAEQGVPEGASTGLERRRGPGRRLSDFLKSAEEGEMTPEQFLFLMAIDEFKRVNNKTFPSWTDVLEVIRLLGYRKTCTSELSLPRAEDWTERADAPSNVRRVSPEASDEDVAGA